MIRKKILLLGVCVNLYLGNVERKSRFGDFEVDTVIGKNHKGAFVTLVDKNSKFTLIKKVDSKHAYGVTKAIIDMLRLIKSLIHTITSDNGKEFSFHEEVAKELDIKYQKLKLQIYKID